MTPAERKIVYEACELVRRWDMASCLALEDALGNPAGGWADLTRRYQSFYNLGDLFWRFEDGTDLDELEDRRSVRQLLLLFFAEAENDVV